VVRRTAAYPWRLRLSDGGTLTAIGGHHHRRYLPAAWRPRASFSAESFHISRRRVGVPRREGRAKIIPHGGAAGAGSLAAPSDQQIHYRRITCGYRRPVLAPRAAAGSVNLACGVIRAGGST
jgi:hypothetical protein